MANPTIDSVTITSTEDRRICLASSSIARVINSGVGWNTLRIMVRLAFDDTGANLTATPRFWLGLLSNPSAGVANGPLGTSTSHFVGVVSAISTWSRSTSPTRYYLSSSNAMQVGKRIGSTNTLTNGSNFLHFYAQPGSLRTLFGVEFVRGNPNWTVRFFDHWYNGANLVADVPLSVLNNVMTAQTFADAIANYVPSATYGTYGISPDVSVAVDESANGTLNAICAAWDRTTPVCRISDFLWCRVA